MATCKKIMLLLCAFLLLNISSFSQKVIAIKAGKLINTEDGTVSENVIILISADIIQAIGKNISIPDSAKIIDLSGQTVLPGLIDCHTHLTSQPGENYYDDIFRKTPVDYAIVAHINAKHTPARACMWQPCLLVLPAAMEI